ncbi:MAG: CPBP family intramembrane metalloprotease [Flavobacteriales bacterium]|nr:CPBP family intramembrane metalloprotease [Flavobacteriales bacterium]
MDFLQTRFSKLLVLTALSLLSGFIFSLLSFGIVLLFFKLSIGEIYSAIDTLDSARSIRITKVVLFFNSFGLFVVPPIVFALLYRKNPISFFKLNSNPSHTFLPYVILLFLAFLPLINVGVEINKLLVLPDFLNGLEEWMRLAEDEAMRKTKAFLKMEGIQDLIVNILLIGILPAIGEELCFRGVIQQVLTKNSNNHHIGIWLAAIIFSFVHFQFFGFLPRMILGAFFGYLFYWTKSLWFPIFAHFLNNTFAVLIAYYLSENGMEEDLEKIGTTNETYIFAIIALVLFTGLAYRFSKIVKRVA